MIRKKEKKKHLEAWLLSIRTQTNKKKTLLTVEFLCLL